jgi:hypothetical protein
VQPGKHFYTQQEYCDEHLINTTAIPSIIVLFVSIYGDALWKLTMQPQDKWPALPLFAWHPASAHIASALVAASTARSAGSIRREEATMTLKMRLNVLAAIFSFAFLTAIVVGIM